MWPRFEVLWRRPLHLRGTTLAVGGDGALVVTERWTRLVRLDPLTGRVIWDVGEVAAPTAVVALGAAEAVVRDAYGAIRCVDLTDGRPRWTDSGPLRVADVVTVHSGVAVTGGWRGYAPVQARSLVDGGVRWRHRNVVPGGLVPPRAIASGILTGPRTEPELTVIDPASGEDRDRWPLPGPVLAADLAPTPFTSVADGSVVFACVGGHVLRLDPAGVLTSLWQHPTALGTAPPALVDGRVWLAGRTDGVAAVDLAEQRVVANVSTPEGVVAVLPGPQRDEVVVADASGRVSLTQPDGAVLAWVTLPRPLATVTAGSSGTVVALGKGHLTALRVT